jgi:hypothetical protein
MMRLSNKGYRYDKRLRAVIRRTKTAAIGGDEH